MCFCRFILIFLIVTYVNNVLCATNGISFLKNSVQNEQIYEITKTWDGEDLDPDDKIIIKLSSNIEPPSNEKQLIFSVEAPFYNDPEIPDDTPKETMDELWEYEVVELFLLGTNDHYLEIELSPKGQYILLELKGERNVIRDKLPLYKNNYIANINNITGKWTGRAVIPNCYLPSNINKFNLYGIHGTNESRIFKSLFPTKSGEFLNPDFHRLTHFGSIDFESILPRENNATENNNNGARSTTKFNYTIIIFMLSFCLILSIF